MFNIHECTRIIQDIIIYYSVPLGFGILTASNKQQALNMAMKYGKNAAKTCIHMIKIKEQFMVYNDRKNATFN